MCTVYLQALAGVMASPKASSMDLSDIHLIVKRQLANTKLAGGNRWVVPGPIIIPYIYLIAFQTL